MKESVRKPCSGDVLRADIMNLNEVTHPFSIVAIRDTFNEYPNRFLLYYDTRWDCRFFPNYRTKAVEDENVENIRRRLSSELKVDADKISVSFCGERIQRKYSESDKVMKSYDHRLYSAALPLSGELCKDDFIIDGKHFYWETVGQMYEDAQIRTKNLDVVSFVSDYQAGERIEPHP